MVANRLEISRLYHRFGFGPKPGEFIAALRAGIAPTREKILKIPSTPSPLPLNFSDLGPRPTPNTPEVITFAAALRQQKEDLLLGWLDAMVTSDQPIQERMVWFWHGHWATSLSKVDYPRAMYLQNETFRKSALGDFRQLAQAMLQDCALQYWLDGQVSTVKAPNENLAREFMELFTLGVNRYSEDDVKALAKIFTGFQLNLSAGTTSFNPQRHDTGVVKLLDTTRSFTPEEAVDLLVSRADCQLFLRERIWYRFVSSTEIMPQGFMGQLASTDRTISTYIQKAAIDVSLSDTRYSMVKSPVEWFISACRALELIPSQLKDSGQLQRHLDRLGQLPFYPPNVGGWPAGHAWLSSASAQYRLVAADWLVKQSSLRALTDLPVDRRVLTSADWLGVAEWTPRTQAALRESLANPQEFAVLALCSPEYIVNA